MTGCADLLFSVIYPRAPFWAFCFPSLGRSSRRGRRLARRSASVCPRLCLMWSLEHSPADSASSWMCREIIRSSCGRRSSRTRFSFGVLCACQRCPDCCCFTHPAFARFLCVIFLRRMRIVGKLPGIAQVPARPNPEDDGSMDGVGSVDASDYLKAENRLPRS